MTAKHYLLQLESLNKQINQKLDEISRLNAMSTSITAIMKDVNVQTSSSHDRVGDIVAKITDLQKEADELTDDFYDLKQVIKRQLKQMDNKEYAQLLYKRYLKFKSVYQIAKEEECDYANTKKIHKKALEEFQKILDVVQEEE